MSTNNRWIYVSLALLLILFGINLWFSAKNSDRDTEYSLKRDSTIQHKVDSIIQSVNDFREIYGNDRLIADKEQKIINNYYTYNQKKNELLKNPADSVYNWTKRKLGSGSK